jgi:hypothetical protein
MQVITTFVILLFASCEEIETKIEPTLTVEEPADVVYKPPKLAKDGVVFEQPMKIQECLRKVPSCECSSMDKDALCYPQFESLVVPVPSEMRKKMTGLTWKEECPLTLEDLRLVRLLHWTENKQIVWGELIVSKEITQETVAAFAELYQMQFPIHKMQTAIHYDGSDNKSMADNNTSAFNCRKVKGTDRWNEHSYGGAIDINPLWNPWVKGNKVLPKEAKRFVDRDNVIPGMINKGDTIIKVFKKNGWVWGESERKRRTKDYQHFSREDYQR